MAEVLQLEEIALRRHQDTGPRLLVEWSSPWQEFRTSIRPALVRSEARLAGEAPFGVIPLRIMIPSWLLEAFLIFCAIAIPTKLAQLRPYVAPRLSSHDVIYYTGDELPRTEDLGGAETGRRGRAGGNEAHHRTQTIRIARGGALVPRVVDAPNLKLPTSKDAVANLLAIKPVPGPPPSEGLRSTRSAPSLTATLIAPPANVIRDYTRNGIQLDSTIPPAPSVTRDAPLIAPNISATLIPPAPTVSRDHTLVAPALAPAVIPPAPSVSRDRTQNAPSLNASVVAPAPSVNRDKNRLAPALPASVIPPAPGGVSREISTSPVQMANVAVVPPPVSAPERESSRNPKLAMPAPAVIAPPPSSDVSQDMRRLASGSMPDQSKTVVPPPPTPSSSGSFMSSLIGRIFGPSEVVPPPPSVNANGTRGETGGSLAANVVQPPPSVSEGRGAGNPHDTRNGTGTTLGSNVIAPPPVAGVSGGTGTRSLASSTAPQQGMPSVVPPPPALSGPGGGTEKIGGSAGAGGNLLANLANNVVPPPPSVSGGTGATGAGSGRKGSGLGGPMDIGSAVAPPSSGGSDPKAGVVISSRPGSKVGLPSSGRAGSIALSPTGGDKPGLGGSGGGTGIGHGNGPGSGMSGEGMGAGKSGAGLGSDPAARGGISPNPGPGGAGNAPSGVPPVPGVSVTGGSSQITLPSFGSDPAASDPASANRPGFRPRQSFDVDVVANAGSGGPFEAYKRLLHGETHTTYPETLSSLGTAVMHYADESGTHAGVLHAPRAIRTGLPEGLPHARMVVACVLDASGNLKNLRVLEPGPADMTAKVLAALPSWKFQPALRGDQPIEVTAILGFNINTDDRF